MQPNTTQRAHTILANQGVKKIAKSLLKEITETLPSKSTSSRRWIWELLQNAKDITSTDVNVEIDIKDSYVSFAHNGDPFTLDDLASLLSQDSTKTPDYTDDEKIAFFEKLFGEEEPSDEEVKKYLDKTGKFGTGFMTTYLLTKCVELESTFFDEETNRIQKFKVSLDRSANTPDDMINLVQTSFEIFNDLNDQNKCADITDEYEPGKHCYTRFKYTFNENGKKIAEIGVQDLHNSIPYVFAFTKKLRKISVCNQDDMIVYEKGNDVPINDSLKIVQVLKNGKESISILVATSVYEVMSIAVPIANQLDCKKLLSITKDNPKQFITFPLVGSEKFSLPFIVNSPLFYPDDPRSQIFLQTSEPTNEDFDKKVKFNQRVIEKAIELFPALFNYVVTDQYEDLFLLAKSNISENAEYEWFKDQVQKKIRQTILGREIIQPSAGGEPISPANALFPKYKKEQFDSFFEICKLFVGNRIPEKDSAKKWQDVIYPSREEYELWDVKIILRLEELLQLVNECGNLGTLGETYFNSDDLSAVQALNKLILFTYNEDKEKLNEYALIPNQHGQFVLLNAEDLSIDIALPEATHTILDIFEVDWKEKLVLTSIALNLPNKKTIQSLGTEVNSMFEELNKEDEKEFLKIFKLLAIHPTENEAIDEAYSKKRTKLWSFAKALFDEKVPEPRAVDGLIPTIWEKCDEYIINHFIKTVAGFKNLAGVVIKSELPIIEWLNDFIGFLVKEQKQEKLNEAEHFIVPNQQGLFCSKASLSEDENLPEELKTSEFDQLGLNLKAKLKHTGISNLTAEGEHLTIDIVASRINTALKNTGLAHVDKAAVVRRLVNMLPTTDTENYLERKTVQDFYRSIIGIKESTAILFNSTEDLWRLSDSLAIREILECLQSLTTKVDENGTVTSSLEQLKNKINSNTGESYDSVDAVIKFVNPFREFCVTRVTDLDDLAIIPNQLDNFKKSADLFKDETHDDLKEILVLLDNTKDYRELLVHSAIKIQPVIAKTNGDIGAMIKSVISDNYDANKSSETYTEGFKKGIRKLITGWFEKNDETDHSLRTIFGNVYTDRRAIKTNVLSTASDMETFYEVHEKFVAGQLVEKQLYDDLKQRFDNLQKEMDALKSTYGSGQNSVSSSKTKGDTEDISELFTTPLSDNDKQVFAQIESLLGDRIAKKDMADINYQAKMFSLQFLESLEYDISEAKVIGEDNVSSILNVRKNQKNFEVIVKSAAKGTLNINPKEWFHLSADNCFMLVLFSRDNIKIFNSPSEILEQNDLTLCRINHGYVGEAAIARIAKENENLSDFKLIFFTEANVFTEGEKLKAKEQKNFTVGKEELSDSFLNN
jgi:hypothetical protein